MTDELYLEMAKKLPFMNVNSSLATLIEGEVGLAIAAHEWNAGRRPHLPGQPSDNTAKKINAKVLQECGAIMRHLKGEMSAKELSGLTGFTSHLVGRRLGIMAKQGKVEKCGTVGNHDGAGAIWRKVA